MIISALTKDRQYLFPASLGLNGFLLLSLLTSVILDWQYVTRSEMAEYVSEDAPFVDVSREVLGHITNDTSLHETDAQKRNRIEHVVDQKLAPIEVQLMQIIKTQDELKHLIRNNR